MRTLPRNMRKYASQSLAWIFVWMSLMYQGAFIMFGQERAFATALYDAMVTIHPPIPMVWGAVGVILIIILFVGVFFRDRKLVNACETGQLMLWVFAGVAYLMSGYYVLALAIALTQVLFWGWALGPRKHELPEESMNI